MKRAFDILLLGYYGFGNLGDELLVEAAVSLLTDAGVDRGRIALLSAAPSESERKFGIKAFNRWSLKDVFKACASAWMLMLGGGGLFQESTSLRSCVYYYSVMRIAKVMRCRIIAEGQSIGPLHSKTAEFLAKSAFSMCSHVSVRDASALEWCKKWHQAADLTPDMVTSLAVAPAPLNGKTLLFNARPGYPELAEAAYKTAADAARSEGLVIKGAALSLEDVEEIKRLNAFHKGEIRDIILLRTLDDFNRASVEAACSIGMRLHFIILSALAGLPCAGYAYDPKVSGFCSAHGIPIMQKDSLPCFSAPDKNGCFADEKKAAAKNIKIALGAQVKFG